MLYFCFSCFYLISLLVGWFLKIKLMYFSDERYKELWLDKKKLVYYMNAAYSSI